MAIYPGAFYLPVPWSETDDKIRTAPVRKAILHTAVSNSRSLYPQFFERQDACSHFYVDIDGNVEQYTDTRFTSNADFQGNQSSVSIETWDGAKPPFSDYVIDRTPWNPRQLRAIAKLLAWICTTHGIPVQRMPDSRSSSRGIGYHRLGVPGYKVDDGEQWAASGKICPGEARIAQVDQVIQLTRSSGPWSERPPLQIDGILGPATVRRWQEIMLTTVNGKVPAPVDLVKAVQRTLNAKTGAGLAVDGLGIVQSNAVRSLTAEALQRYIYPTMYNPVTQYDGVISAPTSGLVRALQSRLNTGVF